MRWLNNIRDWIRGYTDDDVERAVRKVHDHWSLERGCIIPFNGREMRALIGEGLMPMFYHVRDLNFINHPDKRSPKTKDAE